MLLVNKLGGGCEVWILYQQERKEVGEGWEHDGGGRGCHMV